LRAEIKEKLKKLPKNLVSSKKVATFATHLREMPIKTMTP
jgi:hypothetical protein